MWIHVCKTKRFRVLEYEKRWNSDYDCSGTCDGKATIGEPPTTSVCYSTTGVPECSFPVVSLYDIFEAHGSFRRRSNTVSHRGERDNKSRKTTMQRQLHDALVHHGFVLIKVPTGRAASTIKDLRTSLQEDFFPSTTETNGCCIQALKTTNKGNLQASTTTYVSERGIPMYKLGYELCEDNVREVFRIATGHSMDTISWPNISIRRQHHNNDIRSSSPTTEAIWNRGIGLLRHVTDAIMDLLLQQHHHQQQQTSSCHQIIRAQHRPCSGATTWWDQFNSELHPAKPKIPKDRCGDYSVLYAMHYFNDGLSMVEPGVAVKEHVDPSLLVVEPFLCTTTTGLQVWDRFTSSNGWIDCDGPSSPMHSLIMNARCNNEEMMLLFVGKALSEAIPSIPPTLHRVVTGHHARHTIIYEQKYAEFYPIPTFD